MGFNFEEIFHFTKMTDISLKGVNDRYSGGSKIRTKIFSEGDRLGAPGLSSMVGDIYGM